MVILKQRYKIYRETGETSENTVEILRLPQNVLVQERYLEMDDPTGLPPLEKNKQYTYHQEWLNCNNLLRSKKYSKFISYAGSSVLYRGM